MMNSFIKTRLQNQRGFTLLELIIVLLIVGLLFLGLWQLMANAGKATQDQATARQMQILLTALQKYADNNADSDGFNAGHTVGYTKELIAVANAPAGLNLVRNYLPTNMRDVDGPTVQQQRLSLRSPAGHRYYLFIRRVADVPGTNPPQHRWEGLVVAGDQTLDDKRGARIAALVGPSGGFTYSDTTPAITGAFGGWIIDNSVTQFGTPAAATGPGNVRAGILSALTLGSAGLAQNPQLDPNDFLWREKQAGTNRNTMETPVLFSATGVTQAEAARLTAAGVVFPQVDNAFGSGDDANAGRLCRNATHSGERLADVMDISVRGQAITPQQEQQLAGALVRGRASTDAGSDSVFLQCRRATSGTLNGQYVWFNVFDDGGGDGGGGGIPPVAQQLNVNAQQEAIDTWLADPANPAFDQATADKIENLRKNKQCFWSYGVGGQTTSGTPAQGRYGVPAGNINMQICPKSFYGAGVAMNQDGNINNNFGASRGCGGGSADCVYLLCCPFDN
jgi:prepilin-type N-terminal cleavage/methylation domain-containing protein